MSKLSQYKQQDKATQTTVFCGVDVSAATLAVAVQQQDRQCEQREFPNTAGGRRALIAWLRKKGFARVSMEATGIYHLDLALALDRAKGIEVAVLNPKLAYRFAQTLCRSKTDKADALALAEYSRRMPFQPWQAPSQSGLELRAISRHIAGLTVEQVRQNNRLHAATHSAITPRCVITDLKSSLAGLKTRIAEMRRKARELVDRDAAMRQQFELLVSIPGIAEISAVQLLGELVTLPAGMTVKQWVAHSGLDPAHRESGTSVRKSSRISRAGNRYLRRALYMPALVAARHNQYMKAFYQTLLDRRKARLQAIMAVARKMLHAIYAILKTQTPFDGQKLFPGLIPTS